MFEISKQMIDNVENGGRGAAISEVLVSAAIDQCVLKLFVYCSFY